MPVIPDLIRNLSADYAKRDPSASVGMTGGSLLGGHRLCHWLELAAFYE